MKNLVTAILVPALIVSGATHSLAQSVSINSTGAAADNSAMLDITSTTKGMLIPRMDSAHRAGIVTPATSLMVYQTNGINPGYYFYNGTAWTPMSSAGTGWSPNGTDIYNNNAGNVGINTTSPQAMLQVADSAVVFSAGGNVPSTFSPPPISGSGRRMMWYPQKAAFRAGYSTGVNWDIDSIGLYSAAFGKASRASGSYSFATGDSSFATGNSTISMGGGDASWGWTYANGDYSISMGYANIVRGPMCVAIGAYNVSEGRAAYSFGNDAVASVDSSMALGYNCYTLHKGACMLTDCNGNWTGAVLYSTLANQMTMRYTGGYRLFTNWTGNSSTVGVQLVGGGNSWSTISDRNLKTNFEPIDGESVLRKINKFEMTSWNYKDQEPEQFRHYGPMAQDFFAAFGHDKYGTIGCDTLIGQADLEGISLAAIQALVKRTDNQAEEIKALKANNDQLKMELNKTSVADLKKQNDLLQAELAELREQVKALAKGKQ